MLLFGSSHNIYDVILRNAVRLRLLSVFLLGRYWDTNDGIYVSLAGSDERRVVLRKDQI